MESRSVTEINELDRRLLHLLQIAPRARFADAARILNVGADTLARRWSTLEARGLAWLAAYPNPISSGWLTGFVELDIRLVELPRAEVLERLCRDPAISGLSETDRLGRLSLTVLLPDAASFERWLLDDLPRQFPAVDGTARVAVQIHAEGSRWRLDALQPDERQAATKLLPSPEPLTAARGGDDALIAALIRRPRASIATIASELERHPATVRRRVERLLAEGRVTLRCDLSPQLAGWPIEHTWMIEMPSSGADAIKVLMRLREIRLIAEVTGDAHLAVSTLTRSMADCWALEMRLLGALGVGRVVSRMHHIRTRKRMGRVLDSHGRPVSAGQSRSSSLANTGTRRP